MKSTDGQPTKPRAGSNDDEHSDSAVCSTRWRKIVEYASRKRCLWGLAAFRIGTGLTILYQLLSSYHERHYLFGPMGVWPIEEVHSRAISLYAISNSPWVFEVLYHIGIMLTVLWILGTHTRIMTIGMAFMVWSFQQRIPVLWDGGDNVVQIVLLYAIFCDLGARISLDSCRERSENINAFAARVKAILHNAGLMAIALQVCLVYATAGLYKVQGELWQNGTALYYIMRVGDFAWPGRSNWIYENTFLLTLSTYTTVGFQVAFPFMFWLNRYTRWFVLGMALSFHCAIGAFMGLVSFAAFMISIDLALIHDEEYQGLRLLLARTFSKHILGKNSETGRTHAADP